MEIQVNTRVLCTIINRLGKVKTLVGQDLLDFKKSPHVLLEPVRQSCFVLSRYKYCRKGKVTVDDLMKEVFLVTDSQIKLCHVLLAIKLLAPKFYPMAEEGKPLPLILKKKKLPPFVIGYLESYYRIEADTKYKKKLGFKICRIKNGHYTGKIRNIGIIKKNNKRNSKPSIKSSNSPLIGTNSEKCHLICKSAT